jgi:FtsP/CotA-like multicopper oxidase with cupredoxin domain
MARRTGMLSRRQFLIAGAAAGAAVALPWRWDVAHAAPMPSSPSLTKYLDPLFIPPKIDLTASGASAAISMSESHNVWKFHSQLPAAARTWGYGGAPLLGPTIEARTGVPITIDWSNNLPASHIFSLDTTIDWANPSNGTTTPVVPHLHGGFSLPQFDGHPNAWFTTSQVSPRDTGSHFITSTYEYGNGQQAATLWYHDHALGITRLNVYAGLAGLYFLRDSVEDSLKLPKGQYEVPLVIQDRILNPDGSLFYPNVGITAVHPVWVPEFFGDTPVINGRAYPFLEVEPRRYRFRMVNGSDARFYNLWFDNGAPAPFFQIGTDGGFLGVPAPLTRLLLAPGERADVIFDFTGMPMGTTLTLKNNAKAPFPSGRGGQVTNLMQFRVTKALQGTDTTTPAAQLVLPPVTPLTPGPVTRDLVLKENVDPATGEPVNALIEGFFFNDPVTEAPTAGATEVWQFINTTGDAHPMHIHLVQFQILNRQPINTADYLAAWNAWVAGGRTGARPNLANFLAGPAVPPPANEAGHKDTARAMPGEVLRVVAKFDLPTYAPVELPSGASTPQYVYHCHILEHEDNEMMRPYEIIS